MSEGRIVNLEDVAVTLHGTEPVATVPPVREQRGQRIAMLGFGKSVRECPWQDETWSLWGMNGFWRAAEKDFGITAAEERYTAWFDMHTEEYTREYGKQAGFGDAQDKWLCRMHPFPVYMLGRSDRYPSVWAYPIEEVVALVLRDYFTSTVAYMLAMALYRVRRGERISEVGLFGVDLVHDEEYGSQRPCAEYWVGRLEDAGVKVTLSEGSAICKQHRRYGYDPDSAIVREMLASMKRKRDQMAEAIQKMRAQREQLTSQLYTDDGAYQAVCGVIDYLENYNRGGKLS